jgi:transposase
VINATSGKLRTGAPWRDLPERYGPWKTADGTWQRLVDA